MRANMTIWHWTPRFRELLPLSSLLLANSNIQGPLSSAKSVLLAKVSIPVPSQREQPGDSDPLFGIHTKEQGCVEMIQFRSVLYFLVIRWRLRNGLI